LYSNFSGTAKNIISLYKHSKSYTEKDIVNNVNNINPFWGLLVHGFRKEGWR
jgi:hypothetical protein